MKTLIQGTGAAELRTTGRTQIATTLTAVCLLIALFVAPGQAGDNIAQQALNRADAFFRTEKRGQEVLGYVHMGATYRGHQYLRTVLLKDRNGDLIDGEFALVYRFKWEDDGSTDIAFLCDAKGNIYAVQIMHTNAVLNQPFVLADATIKLLGRALIEANKKNMTDDDRRQVQRLVDEADAKGMLEWSLRFEQLFSL